MIVWPLFSASPSPPLSLPPSHHIHSYKTYSRFGNVAIIILLAVHVLGGFGVSDVLSLSYTFSMYLFLFRISFLWFIEAVAILLFSIYIVVDFVEVGPFCLFG